MAASVGECLILILLEISPIIAKFLAVMKYYKKITVIKHFFNESYKLEN